MPSDGLTSLKSSLPESSPSDKKTIAHVVGQFVIPQARQQRPCIIDFILALYVNPSAFNSLVLIERHGADYTVIVVEALSVVVLTIKVQAECQAEAIRQGIPQRVLSTNAIVKPVQINRAATRERQLVLEISPDVVITKRQVSRRTISFIYYACALLRE